MKPIKNETPDRDVADTIYMLTPDQSPLYNLIMNMPRRRAELQNIEWIEDDLVPDDDTYRARIQGTFRVD